jgi:DNA helicase-2/ATP-dependent DNA helicase PcrA
VTAEISAQLNRQQRTAVQHPGGALLIVAGAGSGKTRVITHRIAALVERGVEPHRILAITFTNKAAREMSQRVERIVPASGVWLGTFHSFAARILRIGGSRIGIPRDYTIADRADQLSLLRRILKARGVDAKERRAEGLLEEISGFKARGLLPDQLRDRSAIAPAPDFSVEAFADYVDALRDGHLLDFDDLLLYGRDLIVDPEAGVSWRQRFDHVLVDEYQDTNQLQMEIVTGLVTETSNLTVCGDPDQSIYSWRGANIANILGFTDQFPDATVVRLEENYRSTQPILDVASALIAHNEQRIERGLYAVAGTGPKPGLRSYAGEREEAEGIGRDILQLVRFSSLSYADIAILFRTNALSRSFESALRSQGVPYKVVGAVEFYGRREVRDLLAYLRLKVNPHDTESFCRIANVPSRGIGDVSLNRLLESANQAGVAAAALVQKPESCPKLKGKAGRGLTGLAELLEWLMSADCASLSELLEELLERTGYAEYLERIYGMAGQERMENVLALLAETKEFDREDPSRGLLGFLEDRALVQDTDRLAMSAKNSVSLMTLHAAKGLEFDTVFLVGVEQNILPHIRSVDPSSREEERRLLYVGITRARRNLKVSWAERRFLFGRADFSHPSPFLSEVPMEMWDLPNEDALGGVSSWQPQASAEDSYVVLEPEAGEELVFNAGDQVVHETFGMGLVQEVVGFGIRTRVRVRFSDRERILQAEYGVLRRVQSHDG